MIAAESMPLQTLRKQKKRKWAYGCRRARAQYISAFDWILAFSLFLCMFLHLKTVMAWSLELGVLCKSGHQSGHPGDSCPKRLLPKPFVARCLVPLLCAEVCWGDRFVCSIDVFGCFPVQNQAQQTVERVGSNVS